MGYTNVAFYPPCFTHLLTCQRPVCDSKLYAGVNDINYNNDSDHQRNRPSQSIRWRLQERKRQQCNRQWGFKRECNHLLRYRCNQSLQFRGCDQDRRFSGANRYYKNDHNKLHYKQLIGVFSIIACCWLPARAQEGGTTAIANPIATSSGSVSNQAVQINQGSYSQQGYGNGHTCNSSTLVLTPFYLGNDVNNPEAAYIRNQNFGAQISLSIPLDLEMVRLCKDLAKRKIEKERLDYELVRILKCVEIKKAGYTIHPSSPYAAVCADVINIADAQMK